VADSAGLLNQEEQCPPLSTRVQSGSKFQGYGNSRFRRCPSKYAGVQAVGGTMAVQLTSGCQ
jgi:hypothetical protein